MRQTPGWSCGVALCSFLCVTKFPPSEVEPYDFCPLAFSFFCLAQRSLCASAIALRPAALILWPFLLPRFLRRPLAESAARLLPKAFTAALIAFNCRSRLSFAFVSFRASFCNAASSFIRILPATSYAKCSKKKSPSLRPTKTAQVFPAHIPPKKIAESRTGIIYLAHAAAFEDLMRTMLLWSKNSNTLK